MLVSSDLCLSGASIAGCQDPEDMFSTSTAKTERKHCLSQRLGQQNSRSYGEEEIRTAATKFKFDETTPKGINFLLLKKGDEANPITLNNDNVNNVLNTSYSYKFIIHGWTHNGTVRWIEQMAAALHEIGDFNIIAVDWGRIAAKNYIAAAVATRTVGNFVGDFILSLNATLEDVHVIGHSLGAQVSGFVGKRLGLKRLGRISGLDPAAPLFEYPIPFVPSWRLTETDAKIVDVIHVQVFWRGVVAPCGTIDFYVNNGGPQPDCLEKDTISCSHQMAHTYFTMTIKNPTRFMAVRKLRCLFNCLDGPVYMGYGTDNNYKGSYSVSTEALGVSPYADF